MKKLTVCLTVVFMVCLFAYRQEGKMVNARELTGGDYVPLDTFEAEASTITVEMVLSKLREIYKKELEGNEIDEESRHVMIDEHDLNDDGINEVFVGMSGPYFCDVPGCTVMLLQANGEKITTFSLTDLPIVIGNTTTNGWRDLYIMSNGKFHAMHFRGRSYPSNPASAPLMDAVPDSSLLRTGLAPLHVF